jgi:hypothetical protein
MDELEGWIREIDWMDELEGWIGGTALMNGLEGLIKGMDWSDGQRNGQIKGWRDVVLLYLFYFREKRNFRIFVKNPVSRKAKFSHVRRLFSRKTKMIFVRLFAKISRKFIFVPTLGIGKTAPLTPCVLR